MTADTPEIGAQRRTLVQGFVAAHGVGHMSTARTIDVRPRVSGVRWLSLLQNVDLHTAFVRIRKRDPAATLSPPVFNIYRSASFERIKPGAGINQNWYIYHLRGIYHFCNG